MIFPIKVKLTFFSFYLVIVQTCFSQKYILDKEDYQYPVGAVIHTYDESRTEAGTDKKKSAQYSFTNSANIKYQGSNLCVFERLEVIEDSQCVLTVLGNIANNRVLKRDFRRSRNNAALNLYQRCLSSPFDNILAELDNAKSVSLKLEKNEWGHGVNPVHSKRGGPPSEFIIAEYFKGRMNRKKLSLFGYKERRVGEKWRVDKEVLQMYFYGNSDRTLNSGEIKFLAVEDISGRPHAKLEFTYSLAGGKNMNQKGELIIWRDLEYFINSKKEGVVNFSYSFEGEVSEFINNKSVYYKKRMKMKGESTVSISSSIAIPPVKKENEK